MERKKKFISIWKYKCYTVFAKDGIHFQVDDVTEPISWAEYLANGKLYHNTLRGCVFRTTKPIMYRGVNINPWKPDIFIEMDAGGNFYRNYYFDDSSLRKFENAA